MASAGLAQDDAGANARTLREEVGAILKVLDAENPEPAPPEPKPEPPSMEEARAARKAVSAAREAATARIDEEASILTEAWDRAEAPLKEADALPRSAHNPAAYVEAADLFAKAVEDARAERDRLLALRVDPPPPGARSKKTCGAVQAALAWLARHQDGTGRWDCHAAAPAPAGLRRARGLVGSGRWGDDGGRVYSTAILALPLITAG